MGNLRADVLDALRSRADGEGYVIGGKWLAAEAGASLAAVASMIGRLHQAGALEIVRRGAIEPSVYRLL